VLRDPVFLTFTALTGLVWLCIEANVMPPVALLRKLPLLAAPARRRRIAVLHAPTEPARGVPALV
jgi:hypothetical protein